MTNKYYQKHKERLRKDARERYQNLSKEEKERRQKRSKKYIKILLRDKSRSYWSI